MFHPEGPSLSELCRQALSSTEGGYDLLAPKFDHTPFRTPDELIRATLAHVPRPVGAALDLCCGTGVAIPWLSALCHERLVGIDFSRGMLDEARRKHQSRPGAVAVEWIHGNVLELPYEGAFDLVTCFGSLGHFRHQDQAPLLQGVSRALRPGGYFVFATAERPPLYAPRRWLAHGFNAVMRVRNALLKPPFVMYYLSFTLPEVRGLLEAHGFDVALHDAALEAPFDSLRVLVATKQR